MDRLFLIIGRINSAILLLIFLGAAAALVWSSIDSQQWQPRGAVEVHDAGTGSGADGQEAMLVDFGQAEAVPGVDTLMIDLRLRRKAGGGASIGSSYRDSGETRNVLFLSAPGKTAHWLFKDQKNVILESFPLAVSSCDERDCPAGALYFEFASEDSNADGRLDSEDRVNIGITRPDGSDFVEVLHGIDVVLSHKLTDPHTLVLVYQKASALRLATVATDRMVLDSDRELVSVPGASTPVPAN